MNPRSPLTNEAELQAREQWFVAQQQSYELTQKLTYYVISVELIFCGYMLLNADKLNVIHGASYIFIACGIAALFGILWRFFYNQTYHDNAHNTQGKLHKATCSFQIICYWIYVILSTIAFVWILVAGFNYLKAFDKATQKISVSQKKSPSVLLPTVANTSQKKPTPTPITKVVEPNKNKSTAP